jgi:polyphosphate glucokinase
VRYDALSGRPSYGRLSHGAKKKILVIDVGGSNVKVMISRGQRRKFQSGSEMTPRELVTQLKSLLQDWTFDAVSMGFPAPVRNGSIMSEPKHLGPGWTRFNFAKSLGKSVRIINDAAMQALGSYRGRRMLFLGLGTGLGSTLIWETNVLPLELGDLPYGNGHIIEDYLGKSGLKRLGEKQWKREVLHAVVLLKKSLIADYVVLGGGSSKKLDELPHGVELGHNRNAFLGGVRLWQIDSRTRGPKWNIL